MKVNKIASVVKNTVEKNIRNKWFVVLNILFLLTTIIFLNFSTVKEILKSNHIELDNEKMKIEVVDQQNLLYDSLLETFSIEDIKDKVKLSESDRVSYDKETMDKETIIIEVLPSDEDLITVKVISKEGIDTKYYSLIQKAVESSRNQLFANKYQLGEHEIEKLTKPPSIERVMIGVDSQNSDSKYVMQTISNYMILVILMIILSKIANDISQEKISKSIEYVLTTISAKDYLISKVISINLTLILQLVFAFVYFLIASSINSLLNMFVLTPQMSGVASDMSMQNMLGMIDGNMIMYIGVMFVFMIVTVLILSVIQAALSSKTTNITEAGNATILLITVNMIIYIVSTFAISPLKETSIVMYILSCIPMLSMYFIPSMMLAGHASILQVVIAGIVLIGSVPIVFNFCAKWFKNGVLDYSSKKAKIKENLKTIQQVQKKYILKKEFSNYGFVIGISVILFIVLQFLLTFVLTPLAGPLQRMFSISGTNALAIINMILFIISLGIPILFIMLYTNRNEKTDKQQEKRDIKKIVKSVLIATPLIAIIQILLGLLLEKLGLNYDIIEKVDLYDASSIVSKILFFIQIAILPAIFEELYIRKAVLNFSKKYGTKFAIISSALLFSLIHLNISQSVFAFIMGIILAIVAIQCKSIIPAMIIHFLNNGYAAILTIFADNQSAILITNIIALVLIGIGLILLMYEVYKNRSVIQNFVKNSFAKKEKKTEDKKYRYILCDYSFVIALILVTVMLVLTQKMLTIL